MEFCYTYSCKIMTTLDVKDNGVRIEISSMLLIEYLSVMYRLCAIYFWTLSFTCRITFGLFMMESRTSCLQVKDSMVDGDDEGARFDGDFNDGLKNQRHVNYRFENSIELLASRKN